MISIFSVNVFDRLPHQISRPHHQIKELHLDYGVDQLNSGRTARHQHHKSRIPVKRRSRIVKGRNM